MNHNKLKSLRNNEQNDSLKCLTSSCTYCNVSKGTNIFQIRLFITASVIKQRHYFLFFKDTKKLLCITQ